MGYVRIFQIYLIPIIRKQSLSCVKFIQNNINISQIFKFASKYNIFHYKNIHYDEYDIKNKRIYPGA